jgi:hypothetical protein
VYGVDSLLGLRLLRGLEHHFSVKVSVSQWIERKTLNGLLRQITTTVRAHEDWGAVLLDDYLHGSIGLQEMDALIEQGSVV